MPRRTIAHRHVSKIITSGSASGTYPNRTFGSKNGRRRVASSNLVPGVGTQSFRDVRKLPDRRVVAVKFGKLTAVRSSDQRLVAEPSAAMSGVTLMSMSALCVVAE